MGEPAGAGAWRAINDTKDLWEDSTKSVHGFSNEVGKVPDQHTTKIVADTSTANQRLSDFISTTKGKFADLGNETYAIMVDGQSGHGRVFADGGLVSGPGGPRDDKIPARLSNGEFVVN